MRQLLFGLLFFMVSYTVTAQTMEKENRETLEAVIRSMEQVVDRDAPKGPILPQIPKTPKIQ